MGKTTYKPVKSDDPVEQLKFKCGDCGDSVDPEDLDTHAKKHHSNSVSVDTTNYKGDWPFNRKKS